MKRTVFIVLLLIAVSLLACKPTSESQTPTPQLNPAPTPPQAAVNMRDYFPITPGSYWNYQGEGNEFASFTREALFAAGDKAQFKESNSGTISTSVYSLSSNIVKRVYFSGETYNPQNLLAKGFTGNDESIILKTPLETGASWSSKNDNRKIIDIKAQVKTPAGTFDNCIKLEIKSMGSTATVYEYYGKGIGLIKREFVDGTAVVSSSLQSYNIAP